jgi:hypothetical protein
MQNQLTDIAAHAMNNPFPHLPIRLEEEQEDDEKYLQELEKELEQRRAQRERPNNDTPQSNRQDRS